jgi:exopolyphosphatase / guanosine-5'-triphosphate,3'-diphosphate pyrophosphatase
VSDAATSIVPRWEWRTFGRRFGEAERRLADLAPSAEREGDEVYLLSARSPSAVKVRDGLMDVKHLVEVDADGLEQWTPVMKTGFPIGSDDLRRVWAELDVDPSAISRDAYAPDQVLEELVGPNIDLTTVNVHKRRRHFERGGCMVELTYIEVGEGSITTIAVEAEDAQLVIDLVRSLGLGTRTNLSYPRRLKSPVGAGERYAVIDTGTNSVKFQVGERRADGTFAALVDRSEVTRLGEGMDGRDTIGAQPARRTLDAIESMADEARTHEVIEISAVGTAGLRRAQNRDEFLADVRHRCGVAIEVVSGEEESRLAYLAAVAGLGPSDGSNVVFDTGGGSSQFTFGMGAHVDERFSVDVGAVRFTERFGLDDATSPERLNEALEAIAAELSRLDGRAAPGVLVGMGGGVTNLTAVMHHLEQYDANVVQGSRLDRAEIDRQIELYRTRSAEARREIVGLQPARAEVILAGACIVRTVLDKLGCDGLTVSDRGLRHGVLAERYG